VCAGAGIARTGRYWPGSNPLSLVLSAEQRAAAAAALARPTACPAPPAAAAPAPANLGAFLNSLGRPAVSALHEVAEANQPLAPSLRTAVLAMVLLVSWLDV
jgi:hypothetical protein